MARKTRHPEGGVIKHWQKTNFVNEEQLLHMDRMAGLFAEIEDERNERLRRSEEKQIMKTMVFPTERIETRRNLIFSRLGQMGKAISSFLTNRREAT